MMPIRFADLDSTAAALVESSLSAGALEFVRLVGLPAALALIDAYGGMEFTFPKSPEGPGGGRFAEIAAIVGHEAAHTLAAAYGSYERTYIPRAARAMRVLRDCRMIADYSRLLRTEGTTTAAVNVLVRRYAMSARAIEKIVNGKRGPGRSRFPATTKETP